MPPSADWSRWNREVAMTWLKLSDDFPLDVADLSDSAFRLHVEGLCFTMGKLTEGRLQKTHLRRFASQINGDGSVNGLDELLVDAYTDEHGDSRPFWEDCGDHFMIRHQMEHQPSKVQVEHRRTINRMNGSKGGRPPKGKDRETQDGSSTETHSETQWDSDWVNEGGETHVGNPFANPIDNPEGRAGTGNNYSPSNVNTETGEISGPAFDEFVTQFRQPNRGAA